MKGKLFDEFAPVSREEWEEKIVVDLKGKPLDQLRWEHQTIQGKPFYTKEDIDHLSVTQNGALERQPHLFGNRYWVNYQAIQVTDEKTANADALEALNKGAQGIFFILEKPAVTFETLLKDVQLPYCHLSFQMDNSNPNALQDYASYIDRMGCPKEQVRGFVTLVGDVPEDYWQKINHSADSFREFRSLDIHIQNDPSTPVIDELTMILEKTIQRVDSMTNAGIPIEKVFQNLHFTLTIGPHYFMEIAKIRAFRALAQALAQSYGIAIQPNDVCILSRTSHWSEEASDPHDYLLRATTEAMSAIIGGCNELIVQPFYSTFTDQPALAKRIARNISSILKDESYLDKVVDPSAGSYYVEYLTNEIIQKSWNRLLEMKSEE